MIQPAPYLAIDIETCAVPEPELSRIVDCEMAGWTPPANLRDADKIEARRTEQKARLRERSALLDVSPIACVAVRTPAGGIVFNGIDATLHQVPDNQVVASGSERAMLIDLRHLLDLATSEATVLVGFNLLGFDLPRLRVAYLRHRLRLPGILAPPLWGATQQPIADVMRIFARYFSADRAGQPFVSLAEVAQRLNLPAYKTALNGGDVPRLIAAGRVQEVLMYCALDTAATLGAYLLLSGQAPEMR